jgi:hypothetical protein
LKTLLLPLRHRGAFTLLELMVGVTTASAIFAVILTSGVAIYRGCTAAVDFSQQANKQARAIDYVSRDLRAALSVGTPGGTALTLDMPDCYTGYDSGGAPTGGLVDPVIADGLPVYGNAAQPIRVRYSVVGGRLIRQQTVPSIGQTTALIVATDVSAFDVCFLPMSTKVRCSITFAPRQHQGITALHPGVTATATVAARMLRVKEPDPIP